jgi:hypothetical protein
MDEPGTTTDMTRTTRAVAPLRVADGHAGKAWTENRAPTRWLPRLELGELWRFRELALVRARAVGRRVARYPGPRPVTRQ